LNQTFIYTAGELKPSPALDSDVLVADSFLVVDGRVRSLNLHTDRFTRAIELKHPELKEHLPLFFEEAWKLIPRAGRLFPRLELRAEEVPTLSLIVREAPAQLGPATLWTYPEPDPRLDLTVKGPELALGSELRAQAQALGADEAILLSKDGEISEGALSSLVWWRGDLLCAPGNEIPWLESVTRTEVFTIAESMGIKTRYENVTPEDLVGLELWLLSSLHGIRPVVNWLGVSDTFADGSHIQQFERRLKILIQDLPSVG
jgi:branched-subunit amino acid aminotransferase/4-amino-4-deoxychorismate lyase